MRFQYFIQKRQCGPRAVGYRDCSAEGSVVINELKAKGGNFGYNVNGERVEDMLKAGIIDPTKVTKNALQNAASVAGLMLTTEALVSEIKEKASPAGGGMPGGMGGMY